MRILQMLFRRRGEPKLRVSAVNHPAIGDFHTVVTKAGLSVTFKPTNSNYTFIRLADHSASFGASSTRGATLRITLLMKFKIWRSKLRHITPGSILVSFSLTRLPALTRDEARRFAPNIAKLPGVFHLLKVLFFRLEGAADCGEFC